MDDHKIIVIWMLIGLAVSIASGIENWQKKRFFTSADKFGENIDRKANNSKSPLVIRVVAATALLTIGVLFLILGSALWPINAYMMYRLRKMDK